MDQSGMVYLNQEQVAALMALPLKCLDREYPNKLNQVLGDSGEIGTPRSLHPAFYGCFDWHSAVHGHWLLVRGLRQIPAHPENDSIKSRLRKSLSPQNIKVELDYFKRKSETGFERTYGWGWLLKLSEELYKWDDPLGKELYDNLKPLTHFIVDAYHVYLPKLLYPIRTGEHTNTAFGMRFAFEYALTVGDDSLAELIRQRAIDFYLEDENCPISWEPGGHDFLSPCLEEMYLMSLVMDASSFDLWGQDFLPSLYKKSFDLAVAEVSDRSDGKLVHLDGLNFSRSWCLYALSNQQEDLRHLRRIAGNHMLYSLERIFDGSYSGEHWLGTFAMMANPIRREKPSND